MNDFERKSKMDAEILPDNRIRIENGRSRMRLDRPVSFHREWANLGISSKVFRLKISGIESKL